MNIISFAGSKLVRNEPVGGIKQFPARSMNMIGPANQSTAGLVLPAAADKMCPTAACLNEANTQNLLRPFSSVARQLEESLFMSHAIDGIDGSRPSFWNGFWWNAHLPIPPILVKYDARPIGAAL